MSCNNQAGGLLCQILYVITRNLIEIGLCSSEVWGNSWDFVWILSEIESELGLRSLEFKLESEFKLECWGLSIGCQVCCVIVCVWYKSLVTIIRWSSFMSICLLSLIVADTSHSILHSLPNFTWWIEYFKNCDLTIQDNTIQD